VNAATTALLLAFAPARGERADAPAPLAFLHVESNVDGASGGHSALRVGGFVYHFQHGDDGLLELVRDDWTGFQYVYAGLENRTLHLAHVDAAPADVERVARRCASAYVEEVTALDRAARRRLDAEWFDALRDGRLPPPIRGLGLLADAAGALPAAGADELRAAVLAAFGARFLADERARSEQAIAGFALAPAATDLEPWREQVATGAALRALEEGRPLAAEAALDDVDLAPLSAGERAALARARDAQTATILSLLRSARCDRGFALLVAIARHRAASLSLERGRLVVLDPFPDDAPRFAPERWLEPESVAAQARLAVRALEAERAIRRAVLSAETFVEADWNALEDVSARCREARRGARGEPVRVRSLRMVPSRGRVVAARPAVADAASRAALAHARVERTRCEDEERRAYRLLDRNCVTELARLVDSAFEDPADETRALGGRLDPDRGLGFIPFVFQERVVARLRIAREETILNHRLTMLARVEAQEPGLLTSLREATALASTIYRPRASDGDFLFFTDDVVGLRPLCGAANLGWGVVCGLGGVVTAPFDGGRRLRAGFHGAFFSLPELVFANVRKGSFDSAEEPPPAETPPAEPATRE